MSVPLVSELFTNWINSSEITLAEQVGNGSYGVVHKGLFRGQEVAVKKIKPEHNLSFETELKQLSRVSAHPNIVNLLGAVRDNGFLSLVMEFARGGSLYEVLHSEVPVLYSLTDAISWAHQCATGVAYLHSMRPKAIVHRDLKSPNLLLVNGRVIKICDFGTACDKRTIMTINTGSARWMAPEVFESCKYTEKCDVYSWAIILWEVLARQVPYEWLEANDQCILWAVHTGKRPPLMYNCPEVIEILMTKCWSKDPAIRPSMHDVVVRMGKVVKGMTHSNDINKWCLISYSRGVNSSANSRSDDNISDLKDTS
ncbi:unnamed protein product [Oppiella nova]|uniref:Protein kinase domain-containing protein n=1 Tax=Oppiella nova TaxID=334625 RepID=A0A7R9LGA3_9ACAR|nr:unnamed protein product [Oppiella nova]CAG2163319.1 unnamed protein product [Oppiella nova]